MRTRLLHLARTALATLTLVIVFAGLAHAQGAPMTANRLPGESCASTMSVGASQPDLNPLGLTPPEASPKSCTYGGWYEEWLKNGEVCRWRNSCESPPQFHGTCPNGWDQHTSEAIVCWCPWFCPC